MKSKNCEIKMKTTGLANLYVFEPHGWGKRKYEKVIVKIFDGRVEVSEIVEDKPVRKYNFPDHICSIVWVSND